MTGSAQVNIMTKAVIENQFWVHFSPQTRRARLHLGSCHYCTNGTGMARRPAVPGGPAVWSSYPTLADAQAFLSQLPLSDKSACPRCLGPED